MMLRTVCKLTLVKVLLFLTVSFLPLSCQSESERIAYPVDDKRIFDSTWQVVKIDPDSDVSKLFPLGASVSFGPGWLQIDDHTYRLDLFNYDNDPNMYYELDSYYHGEVFLTQYYKRGYDEIKYIEFLGRTEQQAVLLYNNLFVNQPWLLDPS